MKAFRAGPARFLLLPLSILLASIPAQSQTRPANPPRLISMEDAVRIALKYNQGLRAQRLNIDQSKYEEVTAGLKPNPTLGNVIDTIPIFSPQTIRLNT